MLRKFLAALAIGGLTLAASACNTVRGVGQDLESAANSVDRAT
jgi:predicted small secreted protein